MKTIQTRRKAQPSTSTSPVHEIVLDSPTTQFEGSTPPTSLSVPSDPDPEPGTNKPARLKFENHTKAPLLRVKEPPPPPLVTPQDHAAAPTPAAPAGSIPIAADGTQHHHRTNGLEPESQPIRPVHERPWAHVKVDDGVTPARDTDAPPGEMSAEEESHSQSGKTKVTSAVGTFEEAEEEEEEGDGYCYKCRPTNCARCPILRQMKWERKAIAASWSGPDDTLFNIDTLHTDNNDDNDNDNDDKNGNPILLIEIAGQTREIWPCAVSEDDGWGYGGMARGRGRVGVRYRLVPVEDQPSEESSEGGEDEEGEEEGDGEGQEEEEVCWHDEVMLQGVGKCRKLTSWFFRKRSEEEEEERLSGWWG
ncbi:MAG: hypothetical protein M1828_004246 [Chrysothrix sp. TS-e1954]|nr:MAG: hypothetical protein M1828_004246 [Chrysothrix sp. TS-e1954]